ncbi:DUF6538 domain-containing protein [Methylophaga thiooxydans]|nr:DUF6538 domain-containing protein [Methylophaga thiooxydans]
MSSYLVKRRQGWYFKLRIPESLREFYLSNKNKPKEYLVESLQTRDKVIAEKRKHLKLSHYFTEFERLRLRDESSEDTTDLDWFERMIFQYRQAIRGRDEYPFRGLDAEEFWDASMEELGNLNQEADLTRISQLRELFDNPALDTIGEVVDTYLNERMATLTEATLAKNRHDSESFVVG